MDEQWRLDDPLEFQGASCMVNVTVRKQDISDDEFAPGYFIRNANHLITWINDDALSGFLAAENITIALIGTDNQFP